jgi:hypothetical protein
LPFTASLIAIKLEYPDKDEVWNKFYGNSIEVGNLSAFY